MHCCQRVWKLPYTRLRRSSSIAATSSTMACLSSGIVMIRLRNTRSFRNPHRGKIWYSKFGRPSRPSDVAETRDNSSEHCCPFQLSIATDLLKWRPLLYRSSSRQPRQATTPAKYSNLKCVSRLRATRYEVIFSHNFYIFNRHKPTCHLIHNNIFKNNSDFILQSLLSVVV